MVFSILNSATPNRHQTETDSHQNREVPLSKHSEKDSIIFGESMVEQFLTTILVVKANKSRGEGFRKFNKYT